MSRKHFKRSSRRRQHSTSHNSSNIQSTPPPSMQELKDWWNSLHLQSQTMDHLEHILQKEGLGLAFAATTAISLEIQREEQKITRSLGGWVIEELRLLFLEEGCQHIIETGRVIIDASLAWTLIQGSFLLKYLAFPLLALGVFLLGCCLLSVYRHHHALKRA